MNLGSCGKFWGDTETSNGISQGQPWGQYVRTYIVKYHACGGFFSQFSPPPVWCIVKHIFSLPSLSSCENIFSVKHLLEECRDRAGPLPVSKAAEWYTHPNPAPFPLIVASHSGFPNLPHTYPHIALCVSKTVPCEPVWPQCARLRASFYYSGKAVNCPIKHSHCRDNRPISCYHVKNATTLQKISGFNWIVHFYIVIDSVRILDKKT